MGLVVLICVIFLAIHCAMMAAGYGITTLVCSALGRPAEVWTYVLSGLIGSALTVAAAAVLHWFSHRFLRVGMDRRKGILLFDAVIDAMDKIARGDFDVAIEEGSYGPFDAIVDSVNKMAGELGSMEQLRQDFISNVSHEMQSPLTSIRGFAALLKNDGITPERRDHYLEIIETESKRLSNLSCNLLRLSSLESGGEALSKREYRLDRQIENAALMLEPQWSGKNLNMDAELERLVLRADESLMSEVWINLLHNAVKFTKPGGSITIALRQEGDEICCQISDTGEGIAPSDQMHVFERFYKADKARDRSLGGNGLGLSIVKKIVDLHGGRIELESEPQKGATFRIYLPR
jgi:signal transduction histidine kinase